MKNMETIMYPIWWNFAHGNPFNKFDWINDIDSYSCREENVTLASGYEKIRRIRIHEECSVVLPREYQFKECHGVFLQKKENQYACNLFHYLGCQYLE